MFVFSCAGYLRLATMRTTNINQYDLKPIVGPYGFVLAKDAPNSDGSFLKLYISAKIVIWKLYPVFNQSHSY